MSTSRAAMDIQQVAGPTIIAVAQPHLLLLQAMPISATWLDLRAVACIAPV